MRAKDIMSTPVVIVYPETPVKTAADILAKQGFSILPVVDLTGALVGIVTQAEVGPEKIDFELGRQLLPDDAVGELMRTDVITIPEEVEVAQVARLMIEHGIEAIPVTNGHKLTGIVARHDLVRMLARSDVEIEAELDHLLDDELLRLGRFRAEVDDGIVTMRGPADEASRRCAALLARGLPGVVKVVFEDWAPRSVASN